MPCWNDFRNFVMSLCSYFSNSAKRTKILSQSIDAKKSKNATDDDIQSNEDLIDDGIAIEDILKSNETQQNDLESDDERERKEIYDPMGWG